VKPADEDTAARRPVWEALSDMFLDTDVSLDRDWRVGVLAASPYALEEIERILVDEVYPICKYNLVSVAGVWSGFDQVWLEERILRRGRSRLRVLHALNPGRLTMSRYLEWQATKLALAAARSGQASAFAADPLNG
jgi:hypothetical protein